jgi:hypothetical protein
VENLGSPGTKSDLNACTLKVNGLKEINEMKCENTTHIKI